MKLPTPCRGTHPDCGKEVVTMDDVDVHVAAVSVGNASILRERMSKNE